VALSSMVTTSVGLHDRRAWPFGKKLSGTGRSVQVRSRTTSGRRSLAGPQDLPKGVLGATWVAAASCMGGGVASASAWCANWGKDKILELYVPHDNLISTLVNDCC
jgi:hypothetical protein